MFNQFNPDEIMEIKKFSSSGCFKDMSQKLPIINREMHQAGVDYGKRLAVKYLKGG